MCFVSMGSLAQGQGRVWWADMGEREEGEDKKIRGPKKKERFISRNALYDYNFLKFYL